MLAAVLLGATIACDGGTSPGPAASPDLSSLLTSAVPAGYVTPRDGSAPMDMAAAAPATLADPARMRAFLSGNDFQTGYAHIYSSGADYIDLLVFQLSSDVHSQALVQFEVEQLRQALGADVQPLAGISGSYVFTIFAKTKARTRPVFCQGVWYALQRFAFQVLTCGAHPGDVSLAEDLASLQYAQDLRALGSPTP